MEPSEEKALAFVDPALVVRSMGLRSGMRVADIGAGSGAYVPILAKAVGDEGRIYAVDVQQDMLTRIANDAERQGFGETVETIWGDVDRVEGTKIASGTLDMVLLSNTLFQLESKEGALAEIHRILKPEGKLVIVEWGDSFNNLGPHRDEVVGVQRAVALADAAGFAVVREFAPGAHHYGLVLKRQ